MNIRKTLIALLAATATTASFAAAPMSDDVLKMDQLKVERRDSAINIEVAYDISQIKPGRDREVTFTPVLRSASGADSVLLEPITVAGRNRYLLAERAGFTGPDSHIYQAGSKGTVTRNYSFPYQEWMMTSQLDIQLQTANCCKPVEPMATVPAAKLDLTPVPFEPGMHYIALTGDSTIEMVAEGRAFVDFIVNRTEIRPTYRRNRIEIAKIIESIDRVRNDSDAIITAITIKGFASPEGSWDNNVRLAMGRTQSLKEYVRQHYAFDPSIMHSDYEPEDWDGLRQWLLQCTLPHRNEILDIVNSDLAPDPKDHAIRARYPQEYAVILDSIYPALRHSDYTVKYKIRTFVDIEELKRVMESNPERLRPVDFYRIASSYPEGSAEYDRALMTAVRIHPNDAEANINAANISMRNNDLEAAARYSAKAGESAEAVYTRAALAARTGDKDRARMLMENAGRMGLADAQRELENLHSIESRPKVEYLIDCKH